VPVRNCATDAEHAAPSAHPIPFPQVLKYIEQKLDSLRTWVTVVAVTVVTVLVAGTSHVVLLTHTSGSGHRLQTPSAPTSGAGHSVHVVRKELIENPGARHDWHGPVEFGENLQPWSND
jgi:hypothetical protein